MQLPPRSVLIVARGARTKSRGHESGIVVDVGTACTIDVLKKIGTLRFYLTGLSWPVRRLSLTPIKYATRPSLPPP